MPDYGAGVSFRVRKDDYFAVVLNALVTCTVGGRARVVYDDGTNDDLILPTTSLSTGTNGIYSQNRVDRPGQLVNLFLYTNNTVPKALYAQAYVSNGEDIAPANVAGLVSQGYLSSFRAPVLGTNEPMDRFGATYVFQGTVAEDATAGTHVCTLTVTPGAGDEMQVLYGLVVVGNGAANLTSVNIDDGTNILTHLITSQTSLGANGRVAFPMTGTATAAGQPANVVSPFTVSGTMRFVITVSTATVSLTHAFAVVLQIGRSIPTFTLADTVGTPTLTVNTSAVFG